MRYNLVCSIIVSTSLFYSAIQSRLTSDGSQCKCWGSILPAGILLLDPQWPPCRRSLGRESPKIHWFVSTVTDYFLFPSYFFLSWWLKGSHCSLRSYLQSACFMRKTKQVLGDCVHICLCTLVRILPWFTWCSPVLATGQRGQVTHCYSFVPQMIRENAVVWRGVVTEI